MTSSLLRLVRRRVTALGAAAVLGLALLGGTATAFSGGGGHGGGGHGGGGFGHGGQGHGGGGFGRGGGFEHGHDGGRFERGHFDGHGFDHHFHHGFDGFVVVPFGYGYYAPYAPSPYDTYCNPASPYYDPRWCWDAYED